MVVNKTAYETTLTFEVQKSVDKAGDPVHGNKTFSNVRNDVDLQNAYDVAEAIKGVLYTSCRDTFINVSSTLANA